MTVDYDYDFEDIDRLDQGPMNGEVPDYTIPRIIRRDPIVESLMTGQEQAAFIKDMKEKPPSLAPIEPTWKEVVLDRKTGEARQAGVVSSGGTYGKFIDRFRVSAEKSLYVFGVGVMGRTYLTKEFHLPVCQSLQKCPPFRKMRLFPRDHAKTSIVGHCLSPHILIQPSEGNLYFPGMKGTECRIMLAGESADRAKNNIRVISMAFEGNRLLKALWPHCCWDKPSRDAKKWTDSAIILPRATDYPDPTIFALGVGGAVAGARPNVQIKDDLVSLEAANSDVVMKSAIDWHIVSRALMDEYAKDTGLEGLEFIIGTRWSVFDLYSYIMDEDLTMDTEVRAIVENGKPIWPERFDAKRIEQLRKDNKHMFWLLYMNSVNNPELSAFDMEMLRDYKIIDGGKGMSFKETSDDVCLREEIIREEDLFNQGMINERPIIESGTRLNADNFEEVFGRKMSERGRDRWLANRPGPNVRMKGR